MRGRDFHHLAARHRGLERGGRLGRRLLRLPDGLEKAGIPEPRVEVPRVRTQRPLQAHPVPGHVLSFESDQIPRGHFFVDELESRFREAPHQLHRRCERILLVDETATAQGAFEERARGAMPSSLEQFFALRQMLPSLPVGLWHQ